MRRPVQVTFRNMALSPGLEEEIRARARWLERFYPDLVGCHVLLETPHRHRKRGRPVHVRIQLVVPGEDLVVDHEPTLHGTLKHVQVDSAHKDTEIDGSHKNALKVVSDAFDVARRRLEDFARRQRGDVKTHAPAS